MRLDDVSSVCGFLCELTPGVIGCSLCEQGRAGVWEAGGGQGTGGGPGPLLSQACGWTHG